MRQQRSGRKKHEVFLVSKRGRIPLFIGLEAFETLGLYVLAKGIVEDRQKVALLLNTVGQEVQDLYHKLTGPDNELRDYKDVVALLDGDLVPKVNAPFARHVFRQIEKC